jgi:hypothetical protein
VAVPSVFISSVIRGFETIRDRAALGVERVGMHPVRSERLGADPDSPRRALLNEVAAADIYLLLLGERYGEIEPSPTEEEYLEATRLHKPILVLVQDEVELEPAQRAFLERVRGTWGDGVLYGGFAGAEDVVGAVAAALGRYQGGIVEDAPAAQAAAAELARGDDRRGTTSGGTAARVAFAPLRQTTVLDAVTLDSANLGEELAAAMREAGLVPQNIGIAPEISGEGVRLTGTDAVEWTVPTAQIRPEGSLVVTSTVALTGTMGFSLVDPGLLEDFIRRAGRFAQLTWDQIDAREEISQVAVAAAIPEASHKGFGAPAGNSMTMGMMGLPDTVVAPDPPEVSPRAQLADAGLARRIVAAIKRVFADAGAVQG